MPKAFDYTLPPFDRLNSSQKSKLERGLDVAYFREGAVLLETGTAPESLFVIIKGLVQLKASESSLIHEVLNIHGEGDSFDAVGLLTGKVSGIYTALEETISYLIPKALFLDLVSANPAVEQFYLQSASARLAEQAERKAARSLGSYLFARVSEAYLHPPVFMLAETPIREAARLMKERHLTSLLVPPKVGAGPCGLVTGSDLRQLVMLDERPLDTPLSEAARWDVVTISAEDYLYKAQLLMTRNRIRRLVVVSGEQVLGVLEMIDLLSYLSDHSQLVSVAIARAESMADLIEATKRIEKLVGTLHASGVKFDIICDLATTLSDEIHGKLFNLLVPKELQAKVCVVTMGSEGRGEQIARTDQDNALIVSDDVSEEQAMHIGQQFVSALVSLGYPPCPGNRMMTNHLWCKSILDFRRSISNNVSSRSPEGIIDLASLCDGRAVAGDVGLLSKVLRDLRTLGSASEPFLSALSAEAFSFDTPMGTLERLLTFGAPEERINLKKGGIFPIVHGIRTFSLANQIQATGTVSRIRELERACVFDEDFARELETSFVFLQGLRLRERLERGVTNDTVATSHLSKLERDMLKEAFRTVRRLKRDLVHRFRPSLP